MTSARTPCSFTSRGTATCHFALAARLAVAAIAMLFPTGARAAQPAGPAPLLVDVDSDGIADSLAVEIGYDAASPRTGRVFVVSGATGQTLYVIEGSEPNDRFGHSVRIATVQEAGPVELLVAAPGAAGGLGRIDFFSAASGVQMRSISAPQGARIGMAFDVIADQDGDGWRELIVEGAVEGNPWQARTFVFSGRTGALLATRAATLGGLRRHVEAGGRVYVAADFDDNGVVDAHDISRIVSGLASGGGGQDEAFDVNRDGVVNAGDVAAAVEALLRGDRSIVATGLVTEVQGEAAAMQARWSEVHGGDELSLTWSFVTHAAGGEGEEPGGMQTASSTGSQEGGTLPGRRPCSCGSVGSNIPSEDPGCSANIEGCPLQSVPVGSVIVLHPPGPGCTFTFNGGTAVPADPNHPWVLTAMAPGCTTVRMECNDGACCACQECVICVYAADEQPPCEVAVGFEVCPDCTDLIDPELGPQLFPIDRLGSLVVTAVGVPEGGVYEWSLRLVDGCAPCPDFCEPSFDYPTPTGTLRISEHPRFAQLSPVDGQVLWIHVRYRLDECDPDCCHAIALCRVALYERDCTVDTDQDSFCDCDEDAYSTDPSDPASRPAARLIDLDLDGISRLDDVRGPTEYSRFWPWSPRPYVERFDTDNDGVQDLAELDLGLDPERTHSVSGVYDRRSPLNLLADRDQDLVYDVYELRLGLDPTVRDTDEDGIVDGIEMRAGTDPLVSHRHESPDTDGDGLSDYEEVVIYRTRPNWYDTDNDGLDDFFEVRAGLNPRSAYSQERTVWLVPTGGGPPVPIQAPGPHDTMGDTDDDGLSNFLEQIYGTDPTLWDSDGDGVSDGEEVDQGSNPTDPSDGGRPPNPEEVCRFTLTIGDHSGSHSERWQLNVGDIRWRAPNYGQVVSRTFTFRRGASYPITVQHIGTILPSPDYDYTARVQLAGDCPCWSIDDPHTPPLLGVHGESSPNYAAGKTAWLHLPMVDLDIDSDNNNGFGLPDRSRDEDSMEDNPSHPGKVILANTWDEDGDGLPGFADGFDYFGGIAAFDDTSAGTIFVPVILSFSGVPNLEEATISLDYPASDPALMSSLPHDAIALPPGKLRLWRTDGSSLRNRQPISEGGDFVTPGTYTPAQLGITNTTSTVTLYAEAVAASQTVGDIRISATYSLGSGEQQCSLEQRSDAVRFTASKVDLFARGWNETAFVPAGGLIGTSVPHPQWPALTEGVLPGPYLTYRIRVLDPRPLTGEALFLDGQSLPLLSNGTWYETPEFVCLPIAPPSEGDLPPYPDIRLNGSGVVAEYNPSWVIWCEAEFFAPPTPAAEIANTVADVVKEMETAGWNGQGYHPDDAGAFGKEVHRRVALHLANQPQWMTDVYVRASDNTVLSIGQPPPGGVAGTTQVDVLRLKPNYQPQVGQVLDPSQIDDLFEIKTSVGGKISSIQKTALRDVMNGGRIQVVSSPRRWTHGGGWHATPRITKVIKIFSMVGMAASTGMAVKAIVNRDDYDDELDLVIAAFDRAAQATNEADRVLAKMEVVELLHNYLAHFMPAADAAKIVQWKQMEAALLNW